MSVSHDSSGGTGQDDASQEDSGARIITLHPPRTCVDCVYFELQEDEVGLSGACTRWHEPIDTETVAAACPDYQPEGRASQ